MAIPDGSTIVKTILSNNWTAGNTDSITPTFALVYDVKRIDIGNSKDYILTYEVPPTNTERAGGGVPHSKYEANIRVDIRTTVSRAHYLKLLNECYKILDANQHRPTGTGITYLKATNYEDLSDKTRHLWRVVINVKLITHAIDHTA